jgi:hypothetical protein
MMFLGRLVKAFAGALVSLFILIYITSLSSLFYLFGLFLLLLCYGLSLLVFILGFVLMILLGSTVSWRAAYANSLARLIWLMLVSGKLNVVSASKNYEN